MLGASTAPVQATSYAYDTLDNLTTVTQGVQTRSFVYDSLKRLTSATNPESGTTSYLYDANGNLKQKTDALGKWLSYNYDALNRNTEVISNNAGTSYVLRVYDTATNGKGKLGYNMTNSWYSGGPAGQYLDHTAIDSYDALGRPTVQRQHYRINNDTAWSTAYQTSQSYDLAGNLKSKTYPSGRIANYNYNTASQMTSFTGNLGDGTTRNYATAMTYTPAGQMTQENFGVNVTANTPNGIWHNTHYNNRLQMTDTRIGTGINDRQGQEWTWNRGAIRMFYAADNNGNLARMDHYVPTNEAAGTYAMSVDYYGYDQLNRITGIWENKQAHNLGETTTNLTQQYTYDRYGNRLVNNAVSTFPVQNSPYTVNTANNRLQSSGTWMTFDAVGNLTNDCGRTRVYDGNNKMVSAYDAGVATSYRYNADGQRTIKTVGTVSTWNIYGMGGELVAEYAANGAVASPQKEYGYRGAQMLMVYDSTETGNKQFQWLVQDHLGSTRMVVDLSGTLTGMKRHDYLPFGEEIPISGIRSAAQGYPPPDDKIRQKFTGYEKDTETGLDYAQARYYSNVQGRFTSPDMPFADQEEGNPQSWNLYSYVRNNPMNATDTFGLWHQIVDTSNSNNVIWVADPGDTATGLATALGTTESVVTQFFDGHLPIVEGNSYDVTNLASGLAGKRLMDALHKNIIDVEFPDSIPDERAVNTNTRISTNDYRLLGAQQISDVKSLIGMMSKEAVPIKQAARNYANSIYQETASAMKVARSGQAGKPYAQAARKLRELAKKFSNDWLPEFKEEVKK